MFNILLQNLKSIIFINFKNQIYLFILIKLECYLQLLILLKTVLGKIVMFNLDMILD